MIFACHALGLCKALRDNLYCNRRHINKIEFDTADHQILLSRLENSVGIWGDFRSYLTEISFRICVGDAERSAALLSCGVH